MSLYSGPELEKNQANFAPLTPVSVLKRTERVYPDLPAQIHGNIRRNAEAVSIRELHERRQANSIVAAHCG